jgi:hypothetical protein
MNQTEKKSIYKKRLAALEKRRASLSTVFKFNY